MDSAASHWIKPQLYFSMNSLPIYSPVPMGAPPLKCYFLKLTPELVEHFEALAERQATAGLSSCDETRAAESANHETSAAAADESLALRHSPDGSYQLMVGDTKVALTNLSERAGHVEIYQKNPANELHAVGQVHAKLIAQQQVTSLSRERYAAASAAAGEMQRARHTNAFTLDAEAAVLNQAKPRKSRSGTSSTSRNQPGDASGALQPQQQRQKDPFKRRPAPTPKSPASAAKSAAPKKKQRVSHAAHPLMPWESQPDVFVVLTQTLRADTSATTAPDSCSLLETFGSPALLDATLRDVAKHLSSILACSSSSDSIGNVGENTSSGAVRVSDAWAFLPRSTVENESSKGKKVISSTFALLVRLHSPEATSAVLRAAEKQESPLNSPDFAIRGQPTTVPGVQLHRYNTHTTALSFLSQPSPALSQEASSGLPYSDPLALAAATGVPITPTRTARRAFRGVVAAFEAAKCDGNADSNISDDASNRIMITSSCKSVYQLVARAPLFGSVSVHNRSATLDSREQRSDGIGASWATGVLENARNRLLLEVAVAWPKDAASADGKRGGSSSTVVPSVDDTSAALRLTGAAQNAWAKREAAERAIRARDQILMSGGLDFT